MSEDLQIISGTKSEQYESLVPQIEALIDGEPDLVANLANTVAALKEQFDWLWVGFYLVKNSVDNKEEELVLSAFQGPVACIRIKKGKGVCGTSWQKAETLIVGIENDVLYPISEQKFLADNIPNSKFEKIYSLFGHDGFLVEFDQLKGIVRNFLTEGVLINR